MWKCELLTSKWLGSIFLIPFSCNKLLFYCNVSIQSTFWLEHIITFWLGNILMEGVKVSENTPYFWKKEYAGDSTVKNFWYQIHLSTERFGALSRENDHWSGHQKIFKTIILMLLGVDINNFSDRYLLGMSHTFNTLSGIHGGRAFWSRGVGMATCRRFNTSFIFLPFILVSTRWANSRSHA